MGEQLGGGERIVGLLASRAVRGAVLAGEMMDIGTVGPRNIEIVADDGEDRARMI